MHDLEKSVTPSESNTVFKPHYLQSDLDPFHLIWPWHYRWAYQYDDFVCK